MVISRTLKQLDPFAILSIVIPLCVYLLTLAPSVTFFDSGEFMTAIYSLGAAHSPGYSFFINYAKPFTYLPFGSIAFRVNIATAVSAATACFGVYLLVCTLLKNERLFQNEKHDLSGKRAAGLAAALTFAFSARLWLQSNHDKPYPLVSFLAAIVFYLLLCWRERYRQGEECPSYVYLGAFLCGLAFGAHQTIVLMLPAYAILILSMDWRLILRVKEMVLAVTFAILGFSVHLHMIVRAVRNPLLNWGDSKTVTQFLWNLLRKGYPVDKPDRDLALLWEQINAFNVPHEVTWVGCFLLVTGLVMSFRRKKAEVAAYLAGVFFFLLVIAGYFNTPAEMIFLTEEFFTPMYLLSAVFIGLGLFHILQHAASFFSGRVGSGKPVVAVAAIALFALPVTICSLHYVENDQHENYMAYDYATNSLRSLPQGSAMFTWGDSGAFPLWYIQGVEKMREDVDLLHTPHLVFDWYLDSFPHLFKNSVLRRIPLETVPTESVMLLAVAEQMERRPVFVDFSTRYSVSFPDHRLQQEGICYQLERVEESALRPPDISLWDRYNLRGLIGGDMFFRDLDTSKAILIYGSSGVEAGETLLSMGRRDLALKIFDKALLISPELKDQVDQALRGRGL